MKVKVSSTRLDAISDIVGGKAMDEIQEIIADAIRDSGYVTGAQSTYIPYVKEEHLYFIPIDGPHYSRRFVFQISIEYLWNYATGNMPMRRDIKIDPYQDIYFYSDRYQQLSASLIGEIDKAISKYNTYKVDVNDIPLEELNLA